MEDTILHQISVINTQKLNGNTQIQVVLFKSYIGYPPSNVDQTIIINQIIGRRFTVKSRTSDVLELVTEGGVFITLNHCCSNKWMKIGNLVDIQVLLKQYPVDEYIYGAKHWTRCLIQPINITKWNVGIRVYFTTMQPHGDNATKFHMGTSIYTRGTHDQEDINQKKFTHRYVNQNYQFCCGTPVKKCDPQIFVRKI